jgi:hypothetical protein
MKAQELELELLELEWVLELQAREQALELQELEQEPVWVLE